MSDPDWRPAARALADAVAGPARWRAAVAATPRHLLVPAWWRQTPHTWEQVVGADDPRAWWDAAYTDTTLATRVGALHADHAVGEPAPPSSTRPSSSSTLPGLVVELFTAAGIAPGMRVLDLGTGSGYSAALLSHVLSDAAVLSVDVDGYLVHAAATRMAGFGRRPAVEVVDATREVPGGGFDAAVAMFSVRSVPPAWLAAVRPGGTVVATLEGTTLLLRLTVEGDGCAHGRVLPNAATFMGARHSPDSGRLLDHVYAAARTADGEAVRIVTGRLPDLWQDHRLRGLLELLAPGVEHRTIDLPDRSMLWLLHPDGSWARAEQAAGADRLTVHGHGGLPLWDRLEQARTLTARHGPIGGDARIKVTPDAQTLAWGGARITLG